MLLKTTRRLAEQLAAIAGGFILTVNDAPENAGDLCRVRSGADRRDLYAAEGATKEHPSRSCRGLRSETRRNLAFD